MRINKHDTNGTKPLLGKGELGYDDYTAGGDTGRVYVGTGAENIALAGRLESNMMTKAQFNALAEERKANRAGSGFDSLGWGSIAVPSTDTIINEGMWVRSTLPNIIHLSRSENQNTGVSKSKIPIANINGVLQKIYDNGGDRIYLPTAPNIYPYDTVLTAEQIASGVIKHADASNSGLIVNGKFDTDTSGWTAMSSSLAVESSKLKITNTSTTNGVARQAFSSIIGKEYIIEFEATSGSYKLGMQIKGDSPYISGWSIGGVTTGRYTFKYTATTTTTYLFFAVYNVALEAYVYVDNIAVYPADAISRSDLVFLESWHEDISEKNIVYPLGNVQYLGGNTDGLTGIANGAFTGFDTYSLFGNWQTPSALIGKGYVWSSLTEAQRKAFIANPENNCYLDGDKVIQVRYRVRVVQGWGDDWIGIDPQRVSTFSKLSYDIDFIRVLAKGKKVVTVADTVYVAGGSYDSLTFWAQGSTTTTTDKSTLTRGMYSTSTLNPNSNLAYEGKCYALPVALASRRNQGMYHNVYNPNGTKLASDGLDCFTTTISFNSAMDCFDPAKLLTASGYIGTVRGRPDGLFYDEINQADIIDLRNSSKKVEDYNRLIGREFNKLVTGTNRGKEVEYEARYITITSTTSNIGNDFINFSSADNIKVKIGDVINVLYGSLWSRQIVKAVFPTSIQFTNTFTKDANPTIAFGNQTTRTKSNTLLHCDIIGNPTNYPTSWKESGVFGTPLIVAEDGTSLIPDGTLDTFKLSRKANATPLLCLRSIDDGQNWTSFTPTFNTTTNAITLTDEPAANLVMVYYQTHTSMAVPTVNSEVLEYGKVIGTNGLANAHLVSTLIGKVSTANTAPYLQMGYDVNAYRIDTSTIKWSTTVTEIPVHSALSLGGGASGVATVKVLPYLTRLNGKAYLNLVFKEMKHNGTSFGDDNKFNIVDNVSTTTDNNAQTILIGQKTVELPYFIGADE